MSTAGALPTLAYDDHGSGVPVVLLHGLTFDRSAWAPIVERLGDGVRSIAVDLPGHGASGGAPRSLWEVAASVHGLVERLGIERPVVVGHSMAGAIASIYGATYPALGVVNVDQPLEIGPFAQLVRRLWPELSGPGFAAAFEPFQQSMGLGRVPEPVRSRVLAGQTVRADLVCGYWEELMRTDPEAMQARIDTQARAINCPYLAVFGRELAVAECARLVELVADAQIEQWPDSGHFVHLVHADRFAGRLRTFAENCARAAP